MRCLFVGGCADGNWIDVGPYPVPEHQVQKPLSSSLSTKVWDDTAWQEHANYVLHVETESYYPQEFCDANGDRYYVYFNSAKPAWPLKTLIEGYRTE